MNQKESLNFVPLYLSSVPAGFPSPADDYIEAHLDLTEYLVKRPNSTFFVRVIGDSMIGAGIFDGDLLIVDKSLNASNGSIVLASVDGEFTLKEFYSKNGLIFLLPRNPKFKKTPINSAMDFSVWGVATHAITHLL